VMVRTQGEGVVVVDALIERRNRAQNALSEELK
jgi:hypothetical protein